MSEDLLYELNNQPKEVKDGIVVDFMVSTAAFAKALNEVAPAVSSQDILPVLKNFHFSVGEETLSVVGSDGAVTLISEVPLLKVAQTGACLFPPTRILSIVKESGDEELHIRVAAKNGKHVTGIRSGPTKWTFPLFSIGGYPDFSFLQSIGTVEVEAQPFGDSLRQVRKAASTDVMRPYYMLVDISQNRMRAADGMRFQQVKYAFPFDCQIPIRAVSLLVARIKPGVETCEVGQTNHAILFRFGPTLMVVSKSDHAFPDVDELLLLPTMANDQPLTVDRKALVAAVRRVRITADEMTAAVVLSLNKGSVSVECKDRRSGTAVETVPAEWNLSPRHVSFNHEHLIDLLQSSEADTCVLKLGKELLTKPSPIFMEDTESGLTAVLSQIRLDWT